MNELRQQLGGIVNNVFSNFLLDTEATNISENGALQLMFDYMFLITVFQDDKKSSIDQKILETLQDKVIHPIFILFFLIITCFYRLIQLIGVVMNLI